MSHDLGRVEAAVKKLMKEAAERDGDATERGDDKASAHWSAQYEALSEVLTVIKRVQKGEPE